ncbi:MAG: N-methyl-transferase [uncultured bacterium]|nr:MAG: N-methyl-transferase [uncultured bacterium]KKQ63249.1 MAG: AtaP5 protein [Parcubacteria group bacterium GW2011_GWC1_38_22]
MSIYDQMPNGKEHETKKALEYKDYVEGTRKVLEDSKKEEEPYTVTVCGREFKVLPNVFSPKYFFDTELFAENFPLVEGEEILEIGPGTGAISITEALRGAEKVLAIDINPAAVANTRANIEKHKLNEKVEVRQGDLYDALKEGEKFDTIFWNTPFGLIEEGEISDLEKAVYDPDYKATERFIKEAKSHLKENGRVLIGFSTTLGKLELIHKFCEESNLELRLIFEAKSQEVHPVKFEIFEAKPKENNNHGILLNKINEAMKELGSKSKWLKLKEAPDGTEILKGKRIVMVDDLRNILTSYVPDLIVSTNDHAGFVLHEQQSIEELAEQIIEKAPEVILMDRKLANGINGADVTRSILQKYPKTKVVGFSSEGDATDFLKAGAVGFVKKDTWEAAGSIKQIAELLKSLEK